MGGDVVIAVQVQRSRRQRTLTGWAPLEDVYPEWNVHERASGVPPRRVKDGRARFAPRSRAARSCRHQTSSGMSSLLAEVLELVSAYAVVNNGIAG